MENTIVVSRQGDNLFVAGLYGANGAVHLVPVLTPEDRKIDRRRYLEASPHGRWGVRVLIRRLSDRQPLRCITSRRSTARVTVSRRGASC